jgi:TusA-related sulfurtransferase
LRRHRCDAGELELGGGLEILLNAVLDASSAGDEIEVALASPRVARELPAWARLSGHDVIEERADDGRSLVVIRRGSIRRVLASPLPTADDPIRLRSGGFHTGDLRGGRREPPGEAEATSGFVPLGAIAEAGAPEFDWTLNQADRVWSDDVAQLVEGASAAQWDASRDIPWHDARALPNFVEQAVCQVVTFIAQNEYAAYYVPAGFMARLNPEYVEVLLWLAGHVHDEARHIEVFTKRAILNGAHAYALASTQRSLHTLLEERDFTSSALLLNVLGEGTFIDLLKFVEAHAPDPATAAAARLAHRDELRHVRFGITHVRRALARDPSLRFRLIAAAENRAAKLVDLTGISPIVSEALTLMAAASMQPADLSTAAADVRDLMRRAAVNRVARLQEAGFDESTARRLSDLHTPNLM